jgi:dienelactone hydrolase
MAEVLLFHHAHGLTPGVQAFADRIRTAGHTVHVPDLYEGRVFETLDEGVAHAQQLGFDVVTERGVLAAQPLPTSLVYLGISLGALPAQRLAQTRLGAAGAVLVSGCVPPSEFGTPWPPGVPVEVHLKQDDPVGLEGDLDAARALVETADEAVLHLYPGDEHVFVDPSLPSYDEQAADLAVERVLAFLHRTVPSV